jgi:hypothetical protein
VAPPFRAHWHDEVGGLIPGEHVNGRLDVLGGDVDGLCEDCLAGKQTRRLFDGVHEREAELGERVYTDL